MDDLTWKPPAKSGERKCELFVFAPNFHHSYEYALKRHAPKQEIYCSYLFLKFLYVTLPNLTSFTQMYLIFLAQINPCSIHEGR